MKALAACPTMEWVAGLEYEHPRTTESGLRMIGESSNLTRLEDLSIAFATFTPDGLKALTTSPYRSALRRLLLHNFTWESAPPDPTIAFADADVRIRLRTLSLQGYRFGAG